MGREGGISGCSAVGSAGGLGPPGRRFEPCHSDQKPGDAKGCPRVFGQGRTCGLVASPSGSGVSRERVGPFRRTAMPSRSAAWQVRTLSLGP